MAHLALRPMKWGTSEGTVALKTGAVIPEVDNTAFHRLDSLYRRKWITDAEGRVFGQRVAAPMEVESPPEPKSPPQDTPDEPKLIQRWTRAKLNDLGKDELKDAARLADVPIYGTKDDIVERVMAKQRQG